MQLSTKGRYAVMAMADLAKNGHGRPVTLAAIAERQELSLTYLEQIFLRLRRAELVTSVRGPGGGYALARSASAIRIGEIMAAVEEPVQMVRCAGETMGGCVADRRCLTHDLWRALGDHIVLFLNSVTLGDVVDNATAREMLLMAGRGSVRNGQESRQPVAE